MVKVDLQLARKKASPRSSYYVLCKRPVTIAPLYSISWLVEGVSALASLRKTSNSHSNMPRGHRTVCMLTTYSIARIVQLNKRSCRMV